MIEYKIQEEASWAPTAEGMIVAQEGSPEARVWAALPESGKEGKTLADLKVCCNHTGISLCSLILLFLYCFRLH